MSEQEVNSRPIPGEVLLSQLKSDRQAMMLRKVARKMQSAQPNRVLNALVAIMGEDPEPLPRTPTFSHSNNYAPRGRGRGRGMRGRGARVNIRGPRYEHSNQNAWRNRNPQERETKAPIEQKPFHGNNSGKVDSFPKEKKAIENPRFEVEDAKIPQRESMQDFFKDIETLPDAERNRMIQICIKELIEENKLLRDANRKLVQKQRIYPSGVAFESQEMVDKQEAEPRLHPADVRQKSKNLNVHAAEFEMSTEASAAAMAPLPHELYENQNQRMGADNETLRYEDFVRMRRKERDRHEYEEMVAEQMYLEEMEMRRFHELEMEMYGQGPPYEDRYDPRFADPRFYDDMAYQQGNYY